MIILAIESSCDDTCVAILKDKELLSNVVSSQIEFHNKYGGVMPELASRLHIEKITYVIKEAVSKANISLKDVDYIAFTVGPGLVGSLHVGMQAAKTLALLLNKPLVPIHHLAGHIYAARFIREFKFPLLALVVSGGNTELVYMEDELKFKIVGQTLDDAVGEAYDKVSRLLQSGYPGGPAIDKLSKSGEIKYHLPMPKNDDSLDFSYSGLKSAVINLIHNMEQRKESYKKEDIAASFQNVACNILIKKVKLALKRYPNIKTFVAAGGVSANSCLREKLVELLKDYPQIDLILPNLSLCGDNAAMIGMCAYYKIISSSYDNDLTISSIPQYELEDFSL
ncbi:MAG: tRNA (adenosine(37)-N6)-threonylcarbamoyltransferase complex transferase subunit TsaD [Erysipelotrichaceae bacterium]|nr:tRNA (adenosine(37)-N6)-threonylcarbamoyltransferase complex transferase subunit TsaD [Erysipelotrichaceae bacterium]